MRTPKEKVQAFFTDNDPQIADIVEKINFDDWFEELVTDQNTLFANLCRTIVGQQLAGKAAQAIYSRFKDFLHSEVTPESVLAHEAQDYRYLGLSWAKSRSILDLADKSKRKEIHLDKLFLLSDEEVINELVKVKGIGRWTAEMFLMFRLGREDLFSWGDLGLKNGLRKYLGNENSTNQDMEKAVERWRPYRTYGAIAMWHLLDNK